MSNPFDWFVCILQTLNSLNENPDSNALGIVSKRLYFLLVHKIVFLTNKIVVY